MSSHFFLATHGFRHFESRETKPEFECLVDLSRFGGGQMADYIPDAGGSHGSELVDHHLAAFFQSVFRRRRYGQPAQWRLMQHSRDRTDGQARMRGVEQAGLHYHARARLAGFAREHARHHIASLYLHSAMSYSGKPLSAPRRSARG